MFDLFVTMLPGLIPGMVLGVIFDEFLTTKFKWFTTEGRRKLKELF